MKSIILFAAQKAAKFLKNPIFSAYGIIALAFVLIGALSAFVIFKAPVTALVPVKSALAAQAVQGRVEKADDKAFFSAAQEPEPSATPVAAQVKRVFSEKDKKLIARVVYAESRGEPFEGQVAVAAVVINRFESGHFGKSIRRVVFARNQFAVGSRYNAQNMKAVETAIAGTDYPPNMFYFQRSRSRHWGRLVYYCRIGHHSFYLAA